MSIRSSSFEQISRELDNLAQLKKDLMECAFVLLEKKHGQLAEALVQQLGDRRKAEAWMASRHRSLDGKTAYEYLCIAGEDLIWDELESLNTL